MTDAPKKQPVEAPTDQPTFANDEVSANDADMALAAMGYKPVSSSRLGPDVPFVFQLIRMSLLTRSSNENSACGLPSVLP